MKTSILTKTLGLFLGLVVLVSGCVAVPRHLQNEPDFLGFITGIHPVMDGDTSIQISVESDMGDMVDKYIVTVNENTFLFKQDQGELREINIEMITTTNRIEIWFAGPVKESFPMQVTARQIVVTETNDPTYHQLAIYWAPVLFQDTDNGNYRADYITNIDYDEDWNPLNNWENLIDFKLNAYVYYWITETTTHWFIGYALYHPRDWSNDIASAIDQHENDMEGCLLVIAKGSRRYGEFVLIITRAHENFYSYKDYNSPLSNNVRDGHEDIDGDVEFEGSHPYIYIKAEGHAIYGDLRWEATNFPGKDGVIYRYSGIAEEPEDGDDRNAGYDLVYIGNLWDKRNDSGLFYEFGILRGNNGGKNKAHAPWGWDDKDDGEVHTDQFYINPAYLVDYYHDGLGAFSHEYIFQFQK